MSNELAGLHKLINEAYSLDELKTLCLLLQVDSDNLGEGPKAGRVRELLLLLGRRRWFDRLLTQVEEDRPLQFKDAGFRVDPHFIQALYDQFEEVYADDAGLDEMGWAAEDGGSPFEQDIYVSYADADNEPWLGDEEGWISTFSRDFETRLKTLLGESPKIVLSRKSPYDASADTNQLSRTAILLAVMSPSYVRSKLCLEEIERFWSEAERRHALRINGKPRIFKLVKTFVKQQEFPPETRDLLPYEFYEIEAESNRPREFYPRLGDSDRIKYLRKLDDLTLDVLDSLTTVRSKKAELAEIEVATGATVYLAETTYDLNEQRDQIERDLKARGHKVLPDRPLPVRGPDLEDVIRDMLDSCDMAIHLVGKLYGIVPESSATSLTELQNSLAAEHSWDSEFCRLIWFPADLHVSELKDERQGNFITALQTNTAVQEGAELLFSNIEGLKTEILDKIDFLLEKASEPEAAPVAGERPVQVYLIYDPQDREGARQLYDYLYDQGYDLLELPSENGQAEEIRQLHFDNLGICDAVLIYHGRTSQIWLQKKLNDLRKVAGYGRTSPMLVKAIYMAGPENPHKADFRSRGVDEIMMQFSGFSPQTLDPFLTRIEKHKNGSGG